MHWQDCNHENGKKACSCIHHLCTSLPVVFSCFFSFFNSTILFFMRWILQPPIERVKKDFFLSCSMNWINDENYLFSLPFSDASLSAGKKNVEKKRTNDMLKAFSIKVAFHTQHNSTIVTCGGFMLCENCLYLWELLILTTYFTCFDVFLMYLLIFFYWRGIFCWLIIKIIFTPLIGNPYEYFPLSDMFEELV